MKNIIKNSLLLITCSTMLFGCGISHDNSEKVEDPIENYAENDESVVDYKVGLKYASTGEGEEIVHPDKVVIHYHNDDGENLRYTRQFYIWNISEDGYAFDADAGMTAQDMQITIDFSDPKFAIYYGTDDIRFIVKRKGTWDGQSEDKIISYSEFAPDEQGVSTVWCIPGTGMAIEMYKTEAETKLAKVTNAYFTNWKTIKAEAMEVPTGWKLYAFENTYLRSGATTQVRDKEKFLLKSGATPSCTAVRHFAATKDGVLTEDPTEYDQATEEERKLHWEVIQNYNTNEFTISLNYTAHINVKYVLETTYASHNKTMSFQPTFDKLYGDNRWETYYNYSGDLGCFYSQNSTTFRLWAPTSAYVRVNIYYFGTPKSLGGDDAKFGVYDMYYKKGGVWEVTITGTDLNKKYYTYQVTNSNGTNEVVDPYAKSTGLNGLRGYIYNEAETQPENWSSVPAKWDGVSGYDITTPQQLSIYEISIRDLTADSSWGGAENNKNAITYKGFIEEGTTYSDGVTTVTTGYDHLVELAPKALQLMPVFDQDNNETNKDSYNWGYNPLNYNVPEGIYSSNPEDGEARVKEFKQLVAKFATNENKQRIIMDVVYNHVASAPNSNFTKIMPRYYFRYDKYYRYENGSGCSNEVKSEATMMRKFIVDSLCHWATEYKIKGFRFDLMGLLDYQTMKVVKQALYAIDPDIYVYGEGWQSLAGYHGSTDDNGPADSVNVYKYLYEDIAGNNPGRVGCFNDAGRDAIRGGNDGGYGTGIRLPGWGFISQGSSDVGNKSSVVGQMMRGIHCWGSSNPWEEGYSVKGANPTQCINYASCHDNFTLYDQLRYTLSPDGGITEPTTEDLCSGITAVEGAIFASNGVAFIQGGEEVFRTKIEDHPEKSRVDEDYVEMYGQYISHNSYKSSDFTNSFKWDRKVKIGSFSTLPYWNAFKAMIKTHNEADYVTSVLNADQSQDPTRTDMNYWQTGDGSTVCAFYKKGICYYLSGRNAPVDIPCGNPSSFIYCNRGEQGCCYSFGSDNLHITSMYAFIAVRV